MESVMKLPDDIFRHELLPYLTVYDIVKLDNACMNHRYRHQLLDKISGAILTGDKDESMKASLFKWLGIRRINLINMDLSFDNLIPSIIENDYVDQFRYTQDVVMRGPIIDDMAIFIISHCPCLLSIDISGDDYDPQITDRTSHSIAEHCTGLQSLSLNWCRRTLDTGLITISEHYHNLNYLDIAYCGYITDTCIISVSTHCTALKSLNLEGCDQITDVSIISISIHCTGLQSLHLGLCRKITDACIMLLSNHCTGLQSLDLDCCDQISQYQYLFIVLDYYHYN